MGRGGRPEGAAELYLGLGPGSPHGASMGLGRKGRAGVHLLSYMAAFWYTSSQCLLKTRHWFVIIQCGLEEHVDTMQRCWIQNHKYEGGFHWQRYLKRYLLTGESVCRRTCAVGGTLCTMHKQPMDGTRLLWHRGCHLW